MSPNEGEAIARRGRNHRRTEVEVASAAGTNDARSDEDLGGRSATVAPVYEVTDDEGHAEKLDTRDLKPLP